MAQYDSADLLARTRADLQRPSIDEDATDTVLYGYLEEGQTYWVSQIAASWPEVMYGAPVLMTTSDSGRTYTVGPDIIGKMEVRNGQNGPQLLSGPDWADTTGFVQEGKVARMPRGVARNGLSLYARYVAVPGLLNASNQPVLMPAFLRLLLVARACALYCLRGGHRDPSPYFLKEQRLWQGDPSLPDDKGFAATLKQMYFLTGAGPVDAAGNPWLVQADYGVKRA